MRAGGIILIIGALLVPFIWLPGIAQGRDVVALFSQYLGLAALIAMAFSHIIATRWPGVELVFGPMDQGYRIHKWLGIGSMVAILIHDTVDADMRGLGRETALTELAETLGEISLYGLLILVVITVATFIPYHLWKWTHRFIGIFFLAGSFHYLFILKPWANGDPLGLYMLVVCAIGALAYLYTSAPRGLRPGRAYHVDSVSPQGTALAIEMTPKGGSRLRHRAGQFAFFAFSGAGHSEPHPFTISSAPRDDGGLRVTIAPLGDLTARLKGAVKPGQDLRVDGPYGRFGGNSKRAQVWVAAGIGITPFLALAEALSADGPPVDLIFCVRAAEGAPHLSQIKTLADANPRLQLTLWESQSSGRLTAEGIAAIVGDLAGRQVLFCGPSAMRRALAAGLAAMGVSARNFHYEVFEIRTGLGLRRFAEWIWRQRRTT